jgi:hypothetical protein
MLEKADDLFRLLPIFVFDFLEQLPFKNVNDLFSVHHFSIGGQLKAEIE